MTLIKSISGFRGTIGGIPGNNLTPIDIVELAAGYGVFLKKKYPDRSIKVVIGRDGRMSGQHVYNLVSETLMAMGIHILNAGLSTTPTVEILVPHYQAQGGIILTASHNPKQWNALKLLNDSGEFISGDEGAIILNIVEKKVYEFSKIDDFGTQEPIEYAFDIHIEKILADKMVLSDAVAQKKFHVVIDAVNSTGALSIPPLLEKLGCTYTIINAEVNGDFAHNPEPLAKNLTSLMEQVQKEGADLGIAVDPDVDRLALVDENGNYLGEEQTLVLCAKYFLDHGVEGHFVSNLSSTKALMDVVEAYDSHYHAAAVGEVNVVNKMKEVNAVLGGEGNGGVIYPALHYGRDALVGIAFILSYMASKNQPISKLSEALPQYEMIKDKLPLPQNQNVKNLLSKLHQEYSEYDCLTIDGLKIFINGGWVHLRPSNTEPILRLYAENSTADLAKETAEAVKSKFLTLVNP